MKTIAIHQPNYLPWPGFFHKILKADVFVILDNVDYQSGNAGSVTNRTRIKGPDGPVLLTVPVRKPGTDRRISNIRIDYASRWHEKHLRAFSYYYAKAPFYSKYSGELEEILGLKPEKLSELNTLLIRRIASWLGIDTEIVTAGSLDLAATSPNERIIGICTQLGGDIYFSGTGAKKYNDEALFTEHGIRLAYSGFTSGPYPQGYGSFIPGLSILDCLFNCGDAARTYVEGGDRLQNNS